VKQGKRSRWLVVGACLALSVGGCGNAAAPPVPTASPQSSAARPSSPAVVTITQPVNGATVTDTTVHVVLTLKDATIVTTTSTNIRPDEGHVHLYVDNVLYSMNYGLEQDVPVTPGNYVIRAEFVASDHAPFDPRVWSAPVQFTVK
jgi:hypothetical protein